MLVDQAMEIWHGSSFGIIWGETLISWSLGHGFKETTTWHSFVHWHSYVHQNPNSWLCYYVILWLTVEHLFDHINPNYGPMCWAIYCGASLLVFVCHLRLNFDQGIDWNPSSLGSGSWSSCHASLAIKLVIMHEIHSCNLRVLLFDMSSGSRCGHCFHPYGVIKFISPWSLVLGSMLSLAFGLWSCEVYFITFIV